MSFTDWVPTISPSSPPPAETLAWVAAALGTDVESCEPLVGGLSSAVHRLHLVGRSERVVLRRYTLADWLEREPYIPNGEARTLRLLDSLDLGVSTPGLVAADVDASHCDVPAVIMTEVMGQPFIDPREPLVWAEKLADCLAGIHAHPAIDGLADYRRWDQSRRPLPTWTQDAESWRKARRLVDGELPRHPQRFLHRDFHPNNVHWSDGEICAVVDWLGACNGPIAADLAHCRWNLAILADPAVADHFTDHYRRETDYSEDVTAYDLATVLSGPVGPFPTHAWNALGRADLTSDSVAPKIDGWLRHVLAA